MERYRRRESSVEEALIETYLARFRYGGFPDLGNTLNRHIRNGPDRKSRSNAD